MPHAVAGIIDRGGGLRVVITERWRMRCHVCAGERLYVVPGYAIEEDQIRWEDYPALIERVRGYIAIANRPTPVEDDALWP